MSTDTQPLTQTTGAALLARTGPRSRDRHELERVFDTVLAWCVEQEFRGHDPYDGCNTRHEWLQRYAPVRLCQTYFHKFSPVDCRRLTGVEKTINLSALALITVAVLRRRADEHSRRLVAGLLEEIRNRSFYASYGYHCWSGNGVPIQGLDGYSSPTVPEVIGTEACARALLAYSCIWPDPDLDRIILSVRSFFLEVLLEDRADVVFFRYKPTTPAHRLTFNASMRALAFVADVNRAYGLSDAEDVVRRAMATLLSYQHADGSWNYSVDLRTGRERAQVDFHQGFMLDGILDFQAAYGYDGDCNDAFLKGLAFYRSHQFTRDGRGLYRYPRKWPANIHNQAQGITTFARWGRRDPKAHDFALTIADWTLQNMYDPRGYFHFLKYPCFTNRIPYIRWGQATMLAALSHLL